MRTSSIVLTLLLVLGACLPTEPVGPPPETTTLEVQLGDGAPRYLDLISGEVVDEDQGWDLRIEGWHLFLNGGESGDGKAGGIDMDLLDLSMDFDELLRKNQILYFFFYDAYACALSDWWWYALDGTHTLFSNYHSYVVRRDDRDFAFQWLDYYRVVDGAAAAGYPQFRWAEIPTDDSEAVVHEADIDATAGGLGAASDDPLNQWTYFSFDEGVLPLDDDAALLDETWDLGFKRFYIKSNSGASGPGGIVTTDFDAERGETAEEVLDFTPENQLARFEDRIALWDPTDPPPFEIDHIQPVIDRWHTGVAGSSEVPAELDSDRWFLVSDRGGEELIKFRVIELVGNGEEAPDSLTLEWAVLQ